MAKKSSSKKAAPTIALETLSLMTLQCLLAQLQALSEAGADTIEEAIALVASELPEDAAEAAADEDEEDDFDLRNIELPEGVTLR